MTRFAPFLAAMVFLATFSAVASAGVLDPVAQDQQAALHELNAARWDPIGWGDQHGIDLSGFLPQPPLAFNPDLTESANFKASEMAQFDYFAHQSPVTDMWPNELAIAWGYDLSPSLGVTVNTIEAIYAGGTEPLIALLASGTHRDLLLEWPHFEIGVGLSDERYYWAFHTGYRDGVGVFLTGTVFDDLDGNGSMDSGEGLPGIEVTVDNLPPIFTNAGGGYSIEIPAGKHTITAAGPGFEGTSSAVIRVTEYNVGADFVSGTPKPVVRDYLLCKGREPTILGTSGNDIIYGTDGPDVIHGLAGRDKIYGLGGNDFICGGGGNDLIEGGGGQDRLLGGWGNDLLYGNWGYDRLYGGMGTDTLNGGKGIDTCLTGEILQKCEI